MKNLILSILLSAFASIEVVAEENLPLKIDASAEWKVEYKGDGVQFFTLTQVKGENQLLMISRWPAPGGKEQIPATIKMMADGFLAEVAKQKELKGVKKNYKIEKIEGVEYSGEAAVFEIEEGLRQTIFMISNGDGIWKGQFTGLAKVWEEAKVILKKLKKG